ncbi:uncharacterized protein IL334_001273 [Kwoniella shivajii]|uniref:Peptidase A1 domain-containing protein n=1 Tax=Kwoniella shivajii TaxID=564305 RepID=A0ABZ1CUI8_9TREE|nr:hypothetical protein IL334_001273 [Kwoniella shivajii]
MSLLLFLTLPLLSNLLPQVRGDAKLDTTRIGSEYTSMPLYRSGAGTNVLDVSVGTPGTEMRLTCSTNVDFFIVAATGCESCIENTNLFPTTQSQSLSVSEQDIAYVFDYPTGSSNTMSISGRLGTDIISDERGDQATARPMILASSIQTNDPSAKMDGVDLKLNDGTAGFWGMGIYQEKKSNSIIPSLITSDNDGSTEQLSAFTVGFQINNYSTNSDDLAGTVHWGAVPADVYEGNFNWLSVNSSLGGSWGFDVDRLRIGGEVIDLETHFGTVDPGFDSIFVPTNIAEKIFSKVNGATRDAVDTTRWNVPCDASIDLKITISGTQYAVDPTALIQNRDVAGRTCWSSIIAWQNGSIPEQNGEVRLGTPFMSGIYVALYYSESAQYVGLAGKPGSVNAQNLYSRDNGHANKKLAGILIGTLLGALLLLLLLCYSRNRNSFQSIWYRALRRQQRVQMNAVVRSATLPPPMMPIGMGPGLPFMPPPGAGMMAPMPVGVGPPMMNRMMMPFPQQQLPPQQFGGYQNPPPPYQPPIQQQAQAQEQQFQRGTNEVQKPLLQQPQMPNTVPPNHHGFYSPRIQPTSPPKSGIGLFSNQYRTRRYDEPPMSASGGSRVHFGPTGTRQMRNTSSASLNDFGGYGHAYGGAGGRANRQNQFVREYQNIQPTRYAPVSQQEQEQEHEQRYGDGGVQGEMPTTAEISNHQYIPNTPKEEKKKYFSWRNGNDYGPVINPNLPPNVDRNGQRKSWWSGKGGESRKEIDGLGGFSPRMKRGLGWS